MTDSTRTPSGGEPDDHDHDHDGHDHDGHDHDHADEAPKAIDLSRYEGVDGWVIKNVSESGRELIASIPRTRLDAAAEKVAKDIARRANLKGFRPGKAPVARIKALFADDIRRRSADELVQQVWLEASEKEKLRPVAAPVLTEMSLEEGQPVRFSARFDVLPQVEIKGLPSIAAKSKTITVSDAQVDEEIDGLRSSRAKLVDSPSGEAGPGDFAEIDLDRWAPGSSREEAPAEERRGLLVAVGNEKNVPELDRALLGMVVGEIRPFDAGIPDGEGGQKSAPFRVTLRGVKRRELPALDDEWVKTLDPNLEGVAGLKAEVRRRMLDARKASARQEQDSEVVDQLLSNNPVAMPASLIEQETESRLKRGIEGLVRQGVDLDKMTVDWKQQLDRIREGAEKDLRADWLLELVAREKGIEVSDAEVQAEIARLAEETGVPAHRVRADLEKDNRISNLRASMRRRRTLDLLGSGATISVE